MNNKTLHFLIIASIVIFSGIKPAKSSLLQLTHDPLFLNQTVPPAMAVTFDDSGSMAWGFMGTYYGYNDARFVDPNYNKVYYNPNIVYNPPIGADGVEFAQSSFTNAKIDGFDNRANAPRVNLSSNFIPIAEYYFYSEGDFDLLLSNVEGIVGLEDVVIAYYPDAYPDETTRGDSGRAAFYYDYDYVDNNGIRVGRIIDIPTNQQDNFANWYTYYGTRLKMGKTAVSRAFATFGTDFKISWQQLNNNTTFPALNKFELAHRNAFFEWLFDVPSNGGTPLRNAFYRAGTLFENEDSYKSVDFNVEKVSCQQNFHIALSDGEWNGFFDDTANVVNQDETNLIGGLPGDDGGENGAALYGAYNGEDEQKIYPLTDADTSLSDIAFHFWSRDLMTSDDFPNNVKRYKSDYTNAEGNLITFNTDDEWDNGAFSWNPRNDSAYWQHLVTYNVGMGLEASRVVDYINTTTDGNTNTTPICPEVTAITDPKEAVYRGLRNGDCSWPVATSGVNKIDDVWHASINSRGDFFSANDPKELSDALNLVVNDILERLSRGSTSSVSSGVVTSSTKAYTPGFDSSTWTGNLFARDITLSGEFGEPEWDLSCNLTGQECNTTSTTITKQNNRRIYTINTNNGSRVRLQGSVGGNVLNRFDASSEELRTRLGVTNSELINYITGSQDNEIQNNGELRNRTSVLSDIVHASPTIQVGPSAFYDDLLWPENSPEALAAENGNSYEQFRIDNQDRVNMLYIGSNSGMLHAVNIEAGNGRRGDERWAYVPSKALENLYKLADPLYKHWSYVDNTPIISDAYFDSAWKSVLISGMRYGGQAFFALDVTNSQSNVPKILWEFTDEDDVDMGYSYGKATIARIESIGKWAAFIPNGYNNSEKDYPSLPDNHPKNKIGDGSAVLYIVDISNGDLIAKLDTNEGRPDTPNGLATAMPFVSKYKGDDDCLTCNEHGADYAYAGDLFGNIWKFDLTSDSPNEWELSSNITKVVIAQGEKEQPITIQPRVINFSATDLDLGEKKDNLIMFATGKYIELPDRSIHLAREQYVVGLLDGPDETSVLQIDSDNLIEQELVTNGDYRVFGPKNAVDLNDENVRGWKVKLPQRGERVANPLTLFGSELLLVTSTVTAGEDPCIPGGVSWLVAFDPLSGHTPSFGNLFQSEIIYDVDGNPIGDIEEGTGIRINDLIIGSPPVLEGSGGGNASILVEGAETTTVISIKQFTWRRRGWKNLLTE